MSELRRSLIITFLSSNSATVVQFIVVLILSRLMTPSEVGIFSITAVLIGLAAIVRDFGVSSYLQREKDLTQEKMRSALGLLLASSWTLAACIYFSANPVARYYAQPGIADVMHVLSISFALVPFASYHYALLARDLQADKQAIVTGVSTIAYAVTCVWLAWLGYSYMSMAWANVANIVVTILTYLPLRPKNITYRPSLRGWKGPFSYGGGAILGNLINQFHQSIPDLFLGKMAGPHDVGLFSRANGLVGIFQQVAGPAVNYNALPFIAKNHHANINLAPMLAKSTSYLTGVAWPAYIVTAIFARDIVGLLYGKNWLDAAPVMAILCIIAAARMGYSLTQPALLAIGRPYVAAIVASISAGARVVFVLVAGGADVVQFAWALCAADLLTLPLLVYVMSRYLDFDTGSAWRAHWASLKLSALCLAYVLAMHGVLPPDWPAAIRLSLVGSGLLLLWIIGLVFFRHPLADELPVLLHRLLPAAWADRLEALIRAPR